MIKRAGLPRDLRVSRGSLKGDPSKTRPSFGRPLSPSFPVSHCVSEKAGNVRGTHRNRGKEQQGFVAQASFNAGGFWHAVPSLGLSPLRMPCRPLPLTPDASHPHHHPLPLYLPPYAAIYGSMGPCVVSLAYSVRVCAVGRRRADRCRCPKPRVQALTRKDTGSMRGR